jgi:anti-sigma28 factor (negative regulator of flagellin synthesis)
LKANQPAFGREGEAMNKYKRLEADKEDALRAIEKVFSNTDVPETANLLVLREIQDNIETRIEALKAQISNATN